ncbi:MAG: CBS domain-containing protein [Alphaproteobacteria bacterium]|nr:CBS domain-containing protein [Alphaproteobacteria bacterium]
MNVSDILQSKGDRVVTVRPSETIDVLAHRLKLEGIGAMVVSQDGKTIEGIVSERDVAHGLAEHGASLQGLCVSDLMTKNVVTCSPDDSIAEVAKIMTKRRVRHIPVQLDGVLVGLVSVGDVVKQRLNEMELEANVLRDYAIARQ